MLHGHDDQLYPKHSERSHGCPNFPQNLAWSNRICWKHDSISVEGVVGLEFEINHQGSLVSLANLVKKLKSDEGTALISGIELTKFMLERRCQSLG
jgi:hypothetical protein